MGSHNPIRYRGYYYDRESGFYYLKSRYYDPNTGKFLNADSASMLVSGEKAYTYCENNPVNYNDANGNSFLKVYIEGWDDTLLHLGLSTDGVSLIDLFGAMHYHTLSRNLNDNGDEVEDEDEKNYISYNRYTNISEPRYYDNLRDSMGKGQVIKVYFLSER